MRQLNQQVSSKKLKIEEDDHSSPINKFVNRTHTCGELTINNVHENVELCGWLEFQRLGKFVILRDAYGSTQCLIDTQVRTFAAYSKNECNCKYS